MSTKSVNKQTMLLCGVFIAALASGILLGNGLAQKKTADALPQNASGERDPRKRIALELGLSAEQEKMQKAIFDKAFDKGKGEDDRNKVLDKQRTDAIVELLTPEQKVKYDAIQEAHKKARDQMWKERMDAFNAATEEFKGILTSDQRARYEDILRARPPRGSGRGPATSTAPSTSTAPASGVSAR